MAGGRRKPQFGQTRLTAKTYADAPLLTKAKLVNELSFHRSGWDAQIGAQNPAKRSFWVTACHS